jgi:hypothetical protein
MSLIAPTLTLPEEGLNPSKATNSGSNPHCTMDYNKARRSIETENNIPWKDHQAKDID